MKRIVSKEEEFSQEKTADIRSQINRGLLEVNRNRSKMNELAKKYGYDTCDSLDYEMKKCEAYYVSIQQVPDDFEAAFEKWLRGKIIIKKRYSKN